MSRLQRNRRWSAITLTLLFVSVALFIGLLSIASASPIEGIFREADGEVVTNAEYSHRLIVQLESPSLSEVAAARGVGLGADGRLNADMVDARAYIAQLEAEQDAFVNQLGRAMPSVSVATYINERGRSVEASYQVTFNGVAVDPGAMDYELALKELADLPGVKAVFRDYSYEPELYASLPLINAPALWNSAAIGGMENAGAGVKVASMDGGLHHEAPMFDGTGWDYPDGWPTQGLGDAANNNGKIIASRAYFRTWDPPAVGDENTWPGENGTSHGTHTGSTAAGNAVTANSAGYIADISGVAPKAWVMSYRVFYESVTSDGSFYLAEGLAALDDIVADGADVLNNSWGGGPGSAGGEFDPLDMALINAVNAGVFVSMSAGNAGPGNGTTDHPSDDYIVVAASTTSGTLAAGRLNVIAPEPITDTLQDMSFSGANFGPPLPVGTVITDTYLTAGSVEPSNVTGCDPWTGTPFTGNTALISRGSCSFGDKVYYAQEAGADAVVIYNNAGDGLVNMGWDCSYAPGCQPNDVTISSIFVGQTNGLNMVDWYDVYGSASVLELDLEAFQAGNTADRIIGFSSRGPGAGNVLKPDIAAPGVNILAQGYAPGATGEARHLGYGQASGTSMASPHVAGAAALLRQVHPLWSNAAIKSALMSTSKYLDVYNSDGSPAQPLDMGAGRLDLTNAAYPGVILDPPNVSLGQLITGESASLQVEVTSVATSNQTYSLSTLYTGDGFDEVDLTDLPGFSVDPLSLELAPGATGSFTVSFDSLAGQGIGDNQGYIVLESADYDAHLPAWARVAPDPDGADDVLIIDNDGSSSLGFPDYLPYYEQALSDLGLSYTVWDADALYNNPTTIPEAAILSQFKAIVYFTGDNYYPDGTFTVQTALTALDMDRLTEYANDGGIIIAMGQDMSSVLDDSFFDDVVLGGEFLQDSVTGYSEPDLPIVPINGAPSEFSGISLDLGFSSVNEVPLSGDNEVPPLATTTSGVGTFAYNAAEKLLDYEIDIAVTSPVTLTASHFHTGTVGVNGPVAITITPAGAPVLITDTYSFGGQLALSDGQAATLLAEGYYVNVHTTANPAGEIRGQVVAAVNGDGAENQYYIDELAPDPNYEPVQVPGVDYQYAPLLTYPGTYNEEEGVVAMSHRAQPTLEYPGVSYYGRSIYTGFGLEGINDGLGSTSRSELVAAFLSWAMDEPIVDIIDHSGSYASTSQAYVFEADVSSDVGSSGANYRWDFGDGSDFAGPFTSSFAGHDYQYCGTYAVRVEATDSWGNTAIGSLEVDVTEQCAWVSYLPMFIGD